ncbi:GAF domain-containing protein [Nocardia aurantiaca]|nr:GAF domain-containing protein [Nocardia aurantiaca]
MSHRKPLLSGPLEAVVANVADRSSATDPAGAVRRAEHFATAIRRVMGRPAEMRWLHSATSAFADAEGLEDLLVRVLDAAIAVSDADFGNVQLVDPDTGTLRIVARCGSGADSLDHVAVVGGGASACGRAAHLGEQIVITDVRSEPSFTSQLDLADDPGHRGVQSTPLLAYDGELIGMVSTHTRRPHRMTDLEPAVMQLFGDVAGEAIAQRLRPESDTDRIGMALVTALLRPGAYDDAGGPNGQAPQLIRWPDGDPFETLRESLLAQPQITLSEFAGDIINRLFSVGLTLSGVRSLIHERVAGARLDSAVADLDETIRRIGRDIFSVVQDGNRRSRRSKPGTLSDP